MNLLKRGLHKNTPQTVSVCVTDMFGTNFTSTTTKNTDTTGLLQLDTSEVRNLISNATPPYSTAFLIPEFEKYNLDLTVGTDVEKYEITNGVGSHLEKEEWRGEIVANLYYPLKEGKFKPIVHLNGSVQLLQDARSIMLANEGYMVLELGYNLPQYGQLDMYTRPTIPLEYVEQAIERLLNHPKAYGNEVCLMGHSKGGDIALACSAELNDKIGLTITTSCQINAPVFTDLSYGAKRFCNTGNINLSIIQYRTYPVRIPYVSTYARLLFLNHDVFSKRQFKMKQSSTNLDVRYHTKSKSVAKLVTYNSLFSNK